MNDEVRTPAVLALALAPVLRDLDAAGIRPRISPSSWGDVPEQVTAMSWWPDGSGSGVSVLTSESPARNTAAVAEQLQDAAVESLPGMGRSAVWPECPDHLNQHPLQAVGGYAVAVWTCPRTGRHVAEVGQLSQCEQS